MPVRHRAASDGSRRDSSQTRTDASALDDPLRLDALHDAELLDTAREESFDRATRLAARVLGAPIALMSLLDDQRLFWKSTYGLGEPWASERGAPLSHSFCKYVVGDGTLAITDALADPRIAGSPAVEQLGMRAYLGVPLLTSDGHALGAFSVVDVAPRVWSADDEALLNDVAAMVMSEIELRRASRSVHRRQQLLEATLDDGPIGMALIALDGRFLRVNSALSRMVGYTQDELLGRSFDAITHPDDRAADVARARRLLNGETTRDSTDKRYVHADGSIVEVSTHLSLVRDLAGAPVYFVAQIEDVTERHRADRAVRDERALLSTVLEQMSDVVFVVDLNGNPIIENRTAREILGAGRESARPDAVRLFVDEDGTPCPPEEEPIARAHGGESVLPTELFVRAPLYPEGRWFSVSAAPVHDERGDVVAAVTVARDITSQRRAAAMLTLLNDVTSAANNATRGVDAIARVLPLLVRRARMSIGHCWVRKGTRMVSSGVFDAERTRFERFRAATETRTYAPGEGTIGRMMIEGGLSWFDELGREPEFLRAAPAQEDGLRSMLAFAVMVRDAVVAVVEMFGATDESPTIELLEALPTIAEQLARAFEREQHDEAVRALALTDELTGLLNRRGFLALATQQMRLAQRSGRPMVLLFADLDGLKTINDQLGHDEGDRAIAAAAAVLRETFRDADMIARLGGDELVVVAPDTDSTSVPALTARLERALAARNARGDLPFQLAMSVGIAVLDPAKAADTSIEELLAQADEAMYAQKRARRAAR